MKFLVLSFILLLTACDNSAEPAQQVVEDKTTPVVEENTEPLKVTVTDTDNIVADRIIGDADAPVTVIEYASFTCGHCGNFHRKVYPTLKKDYIDSGKVKFIYRSFPLDSLALQAAQLTYCMPKDFYYTFVSLLYDRQDYWVQPKTGEERLKGLAASAGLNESEIEACLNNEALRNAIAQQRQQATTKYDVRFTPTLIVDEENKGSVGKVEELKAILD